MLGVKEKSQVCLLAGGARSQNPSWSERKDTGLIEPSGRLGVSAKISVDLQPGDK